MEESVTGAAVEAVTEAVKDVNQFTTYFENIFLPGIIDFGINLFISLIIYFIGSKFIKFVCKLVKKALARANVETGVIQFLNSILKCLLYLVLILMVVSRFGFEATSVIAILGSAGVAIGLALQGSLSNLAGGVLILVLKPFQIGDYIMEDGGKEGTVKEIQLFYTKLLTVDNKEISIPNGTLANERVINVSKQEERRLDLAIGISYEADIKKAKAVLTQIAEGDIACLRKNEIQVFVQDLGDSAVILGCRIWVRNEEYWNAKFRLLETIKEKFDGEGIAIPYNQLEVQVTQVKEQE